MADHNAENRQLQADNKGLENKIGKLENAHQQQQKQIEKVVQQKDNLKAELDNTAAMLSAGQREAERLRKEASQVGSCFRCYIDNCMYTNSYMSCWRHPRADVFVYSFSYTLLDKNGFRHVKQMRIWKGKIMCWEPRTLSCR